MMKKKNLSQKKHEHVKFAYVYFGFVICTACMFMIFAGCKSNHDEESPATSLEKQPEAKAKAGPGDSVDLGKVLAGEIVKHTFVYANTSETKVKLDPQKDLQKSCGCLSVEVAKTELDPGEKTDILMSISTYRKHGKFVEKVALVWHEENGSKAAQVYSLQGNIVSTFRLDPTHVYFSEKDVRDNRTVEVCVKSDLDLDWSTFVARADSKTIKCSVKESSKEKDCDKLLRVSLNSKEISGSARYNIALSAKPVKGAKGTPGNAKWLYGKLPIMLEDPGLFRVRTKSVGLNVVKEPSPHYTGQITIQAVVPPGKDIQKCFRITLGDIPQKDPNGENIKYKIIQLTQSLFRIDFQIPEKNLVAAKSDTGYCLRVYQDDESEPVALIVR